MILRHGRRRQSMTTGSDPMTRFVLDSATGSDPMTRFVLDSETGGGR